MTSFLVSRFYNATGAPPSTLEVAATQLEQLITIKGAGSARGETGEHVKDVTLRGLKLTGAAMSYLSPHGLPSDGGGDWALSRTGAVNIEGAENVLVEVRTTLSFFGLFWSAQFHAKNRTFVKTGCSGQTQERVETKTDASAGLPLRAHRR
jgi:hypothetical protein